MQQTSKEQSLVSAERILILSLKCSCKREKKPINRKTKNPEKRLGTRSCFCHLTFCHFFAQEAACDNGSPELDAFVFPKIGGNAPWAAARWLAQAPPLLFSVFHLRGWQGSMLRELASQPQEFMGWRTGVSRGSREVWQSEIGFTKRSVVPAAGGQ